MAVDLSLGADVARAGEAEAARSAARSLPFPRLREDLKLLPGPSSNDGSPTWTLHDPARHRFLRIGWLEFEVLARWDLGDADAIAASISSETMLRARSEDALDVLAFAQRAGLIATTARQLSTEAERERLSTPRWLLKNYLSLKVRLISPDALLNAAVPKISWMFTRGFALALGALALLGFYLISRQWDAYTHSLLHLFSLQGALQVGLALASAKVIHEIGHGVMAKRMGCRVPAMGVALIVMWPVLWTDTTDAWRLTDRHKRLAIDAAGMLAELTLAVAASLAWSVLPDGALRTGAFLLSSSTWILTLAVNLNPLMRFDGYFLLSDWLDVPNLQEQGLAMGRWWLRERLFALGDPPPERLPPHLHRVLIVYALATMVYRFSLFLGIALTVYHMAFKALGIFLMSVEIGWFLVRPIAAEILVWRRRLAEGRRPSLASRPVATLACCAFVLLALILPWRRELLAPALERAERQTTLYVSEPGQLVSRAENGRRVAGGDPVFVLASPSLNAQKLGALAKLAGIDARMKGQSFDAGQADMIEVGQKELEGAFASVDQINAQQALLSVRAPFSGEVVDVPPTLHEGEWLARREPLGVLIDPSSTRVEAFVSESDLSRLHPGAQAKFFPENGDPPIALEVESISGASVSSLDVPELASIYGGGVAVRKEADNRLVPEASIYRVLLRPTDRTIKVGRRLRGEVSIEADRTSVLGQVYRRAVAVLIREAQL